jgi:hypothetical protein
MSPAVARHPVLAAAELASGGYLPEGTPTGECALCGSQTALVSVEKVVSRNFTDWDVLTGDKAGVCVLCAWAFTAPLPKTNPLVITTEPAARVASRDDLRTFLAQPLTSDAAITVPVSGKKHLLPRAAWGMVISDNGPLTWGEEAAAAFAAVVELRDLGVSEAAFASLAPPADVAAANPSVLDTWSALGLWRSGPYWPVLLRASRPDMARR